MEPSLSFGGRVHGASARTPNSCSLGAMELCNLTPQPTPGPLSNGVFGEPEWRQEQATHVCRADGADQACRRRPGGHRVGQCRVWLFPARRSRCESSNGPVRPRILQIERRRRPTSAVPQVARAVTSCSVGSGAGRQRERASAVRFPLPRINLGPFKGGVAGLACFCLPLA
jgi:hypothetical protein